MAVMQLANDWHGDIKPGKDAISFIENKLTFKSNQYELSALSRSYHEFEIDNDLARGFYFYNNNISLENEMRIQAELKAKTYSGHGIQFAHQFQPLKHEHYQISIKPKLTALRLDDIIWGSLEGELFYNDTKNWGGTIDLDYGYTKDHVVRRPLRGEYIGQLYGLDLDMDLTSQWLTVNYQGMNLISRIYWDGLPKTTAQVSTETAFLLFGYEYFEDVNLDAPDIHFIQAHGTFDHSSLIALNWMSSARVTPVRSFYYHGIKYLLNDTFQLAMQYDFSSSTTRLSLNHPNVAATIASQTLDLSKSQQLEVRLDINYQF
jgi:hypothetical protein